jgi:K+ transporter
MSPSPTSYYNEFKILFYILLIVYAEKLFFIFEKIFENEKQLEDKMEEYFQKTEKKIGASTFFSSLRIQLKNLLLQSLKENDVPAKKNE